MLTSFTLRALARRTAAATLALAGLASAPAAGQAAEPPFYLSITDHIGLPGEAQPDSAYVFDYYWRGLAPTALLLERKGKLIAGGGTPRTDLRAAAIEDGDVFVVRVRASDDYPYYPGYPSYPGYPNYPSEFRYTYHRSPAFDAPVCAGAASYSGTRRSPSWTPYFGSAVLWKADLTKQSNPAYPWQEAPFPESEYPAWYPGFALADSATVAILPTGTKFSAVPSKPLVPGMRIATNEYFEDGDFAVSLNAETEVKDCSTAPKPAPMATIAPTSSPAPSASPTPVPDKTAPKGTVTAPSVKALKKLGAKKLLKSGVPLTITVNEPAQLKGAISLLGGKKPVRSAVSLPLKPGKNAVKVIVPNALRKAVKKVSKKKAPKLQLKLALVDQAGNSQPLKTITVKLPKK